MKIGVSNGVGLTSPLLSADISRMPVPQNLADPRLPRSVSVKIILEKSEKMVIEGKSRFSL